MTTILSTEDTILLAIPMIGLLLAGYFRLDELLGKPKKPARARRAIAGLDEIGRPLCADPDGRVPGRGSR